MGDLKNLLSQFDKPAVGCMQYFVAWLALLDDDLDAREQAILNELTSSGSPGRARAIRETAQKGLPDDLAIACTGLRDLDATSRQLTLEYAVMVAVADQRLTVGENHALRFLADVLDLNPSNLDQTYRSLTGRSLPLPNDLARADSWKRKRSTENGSGKAAGGDSRHENTEQQRANDSTGGSGNSQMSRAQAAEILGVAPNASEEEIKQAYRHLAQRTHPDRFRTLGDEAMTTAQNWFHRVTKAYERLRQSQ